MKGIFTVSLDFELHWGGFEKWPLSDYRTYFLNTRAVIPEMLALFEEFEVHVTWATVGLLFYDNKETMQHDFPKEKPAYDMQDLSAYHYMKTVGIGDDEQSDPFHYAASLVKKVLATPHQELATHTFAHYYCNEKGQTPEQFRADLRSAQKAAKRFGITLTSLVFPRNQFNDQYLQVCFEEGITAVRSNPMDWFWNIQSTLDESKWKRLNRGLDAYLPVGKHNTYRLSDLKTERDRPACLPSSRLLRPYRKKELFLNTLKIRRIKQEMERAAKAGEVYHLWWHPHNFGNFPTASLAGLRSILEMYKECRETFGMSSLNMKEIVDQINRGNA